MGEAALGVVQGFAVRGDQAGRVGAGGGRGDLLPEDGPHGELGLVDRARHPAAGALVDQRCEQRIGAQPFVDGDRVGVQVEQAAAAADGHGQVAQVAQGEPAGDVVGAGGERDDAVPVRQPERAPVGAVPPLLDAGYGGGGEVAEEVGRVERGAERQPQGERAGGCPRRSLGARARSSLGERAKTSRTVSLKVRMEEKPAANATSAMGSAVVSTSSRAVWARWARASARGPAPSSASSCRSTCRVL